MTDYNEKTFFVKVWKNGKFGSPNLAYGLIVEKEDRDKFFSNDFHKIILDLEGGYKIEVNTNKKSFWGDKCRELISMKIKDWLIENEKNIWSDRNPPKLRLEKTGENEFKIYKK